MSKTLLKQVRFGIIGFVGVLLMMIFSACAGVTGTTGANGSNGTGVITGSIQSVNTANHSVTINVNNQSYTIGGLSDQQVQALQTQVGKVYTVNVTINGNTYTISTGSNPQADDNATPGVSDTPESNSSNSTQNEPGNIQFIGKVQSVNGNTITVAMPNGQTITMNIVSGQTDLSDFNNAAPGVGTLVKAEADANTTDGSFLANKISATDSGDVAKQNNVEFQGVTTSAVSNNTINFSVGNKSFSFQLNASTDLGDFNNNAQSIPANQSVKVEVTFNGSNATVTKVSNASN